MARQNKSSRYCIGLIIAACLFLPSCGSKAVEEISLKDLADLPSKHPIVVVNFWATWCPPCLTEIPLLNRFQQSRQDVHIYGISIDDAALGTEVFKFVEKYKIQYPVYVRERMEESGQEWYQNVDAIPMTYVFKDGKKHNSILGAIEEESELAQVIDGPSEEEEFADAEEESEEEEFSADEDE